MRFFFQLISVLHLLKIADEGFLTGPEEVNNLNENCLLLNVSIAIIGAGFSGLSAFNRLVELGLHNVQIFEASNRVGGRVFPLEFEGIFLQQGAEFINGKNNKIYEVALRLGIITGQMDDSALISEDAQFVSPTECQIPQQIIDKFAEFTSFLELGYAEMAIANHSIWSRTISELFDKDYANFLKSMNVFIEERINYDRLAQVYRGYYEGEWSAPIEKLAVHNYAQWKDGSQSFPFNSYTLNSRGYEPILAELAEIVPINKLNLNTRITQIDYKDNGIRLKIQKNKNNMEEEWLSTHFDFVIITLPIGHLKRFSSTLFYPQLPTEKLKIIEAIGFGTIQKVFLIYDKPFWPDNMTSLVALSCNSENNSEERIKEVLHTLQPHPWAQDRVLVLWLSGNGPRLVNSLTDENLSELLTKHLREVLPDKNVRPPVKIIRTKWLDDQLFFGSYTYITPEASLLSDDPFFLLAEPIYQNKGKKLKLLFAGEGTHSQMFQTTIGAFESGQREANRIAEYLIGINGKINYNYFAITKEKKMFSFFLLIKKTFKIQKKLKNSSQIDLKTQRLFFLSLALTAIAFCILSVFIPMLIVELDELNEIANSERKVFNKMTKEIWNQLIYLRGSTLGNSQHTFSRLLQLKRRTERESPLKINGNESRRFLDHLERKSFKGRQRINRKLSNLWEINENQIGANLAAPRARTFSYGTIKEKKLLKEKVFSVPLKCEKGPPGDKGLAGIDGVPGQNGEPGIPGQSTNEQEKNLSNSGCIKCPAGPPGLPGERGVTGINGEVGMPGVPGKAKKALPGKPGPVGEPGLDGVDGMNGEPGFPGVPGIKYSKGPSGDKGKAGQVGIPGLPGDEGLKGESGPPGEIGWQGLPGENGPDGQIGGIGPIGDSGFPGIERHYCNCPVRTSHLRQLKEQSGGVDAYLGRWKGRLPNQLLVDYEKYVKEKDSVTNKINKSLGEVVVEN